MISVIIMQVNHNIMLWVGTVKRLCMKTKANKGESLFVWIPTDTSVVMAMNGILDALDDKLKQKIASI